MLLTSKDAKVSRRRTIAYLIAPTILAAGFGVAAAAPAAHATACEHHSGKTSNLTLIGTGLSPTGGTIWTKPSGSGCSDLKVVSVGASDSYEGWLFDTSTSTWSACSEGFVKIGASSTSNPVLCSGVKAGTRMAVVQESSTQRSITIQD